MSNHGCMVTRETLHFGTQILTWVSFCRGLRSCLQQKVMLAVLWSDCSLFTLLWKERYVLAELPLLVPSVLPLKICFGKIYGMHAFYWPLQLFSAQFLGNTLKCIVRYYQGAQVWNLLINFLPAHNVSPMLWHSHYCFRFFIMPFHLPVQSLNQKWGPREISSRIESAYRQKLPIESLLREVAHGAAIDTRWTGWWWHCLKKSGCPRHLLTNHEQQKGRKEALKSMPHYTMVQIQENHQWHPNSWSLKSPLALRRCRDCSFASPRPTCWLTGDKKG